MICREAYRNVRHSVCYPHYKGTKPLPAHAPALSPVEDAREADCEFCADEASEARRRHLEAATDAMRTR